MPKDSPCQVVLVTAPGREEAERLAQRLVEDRLAACVNCAGPVTSVYRWEGKTCREQEFLLVIKTTAERLDALFDRVAALHSYEVPEIIALPVTAGWPPYLEWVRSETRQG